MLLSWSDFEKCTPSYFRQLWNDQDFTDVTLATVDGHQLNTHKVIISSCSPLFENILKKNKHPNPLIYFKDLKYRDLERVLKFMYLGEVEVPEEDLQDFLVAGTELKVGGLIKDNENINGNCSTIPNPDQPVGAIQKSPNNKSEIMQRDDAIDSEYSQVKQEIMPHELLDIVIEGKRFKCEQCNYASKRRDKLIDHTRNKHEGITYDCQYCDYKATVNTSLNLHTKIKHEGFRYNCDQCDYTVKEIRYLKRHKETQHDFDNILTKKENLTH